MWGLPRQLPKIDAKQAYKLKTYIVANLYKQMHFWLHKN